MTEKKPDKCFNCKERTDDLTKVRQKGKIRWWCDTCIAGYKEEKKREEAEKKQKWGFSEKPTHHNEPRQEILGEEV